MSPILKKMINQANNALPHAYAPYSNFHVACCIEDTSGKLHTGVNVENASYSLVLCAESGAIANMVASGERTIRQVVIVNAQSSLCPPCGACRQRLYEFSSEDTLVHLCNNDGILQSHTIKQLLPLAFDLPK